MLFAIQKIILYVCWEEDGLKRHNDRDNGRNPNLGGGHGGPCLKIRPCLQEVSIDVPITSLVVMIVALERL